jgi:hypothetical protein
VSHDILFSLDNGFKLMFILEPFLLGVTAQFEPLFNLCRITHTTLEYLKLELLNCPILDEIVYIFGDELSEVLDTVRVVPCDTLPKNRDQRI